MEKYFFVFWGEIKSHYFNKELKGREHNFSFPANPKFRLKNLLTLFLNFWRMFQKKKKKKLRKNPPKAHISGRFFLLYIKKSLTKSFGIREFWGFQFGQNRLLGK